MAILSFWKRPLIHPRSPTCDTHQVNKERADDWRGGIISLEDIQ